MIYNLAFADFPAASRFSTETLEAEKGIKACNTNVIIQDEQGKGDQLNKGGHSMRRPASTFGKLPSDQLMRELNHCAADSVNHVRRS